MRSEPGPDGRPVFRTKGDNNPAEDLRPFTLDRPEQTRFAFAVPYAGYLFIALASQEARFVAARPPRARCSRSGCSRGCGATPAGCWRSSGRVKALLVLAALALLGLTVPASDARFNKVTTNTGAIAADSAGAYFHVYSQSTDPGGGDRLRDAPPQQPAGARGDRGRRRDLRSHMGGWRNQNATYVDRVVTIKAPATFPAGVTQLTLARRGNPDPTTGEQPLTAGRFQRMNDTGGGATITLSPGEQVELDLEVTMRPPDFPNGGPGPASPTRRRSPSGRRGPDYTDDFFAYVIPVRVYNGNGPG